MRRPKDNFARELRFVKSLWEEMPKSVFQCLKVGFNTTPFRSWAATLSSLRMTVRDAHRMDSLVRSRSSRKHRHPPVIEFPT